MKRLFKFFDDFFHEIIFTLLAVVLILKLLSLIGV